MAKARQGQTFTCQFCGTLFYRRPSHILRGIVKTCGAPSCKSKAVMGENNPYWGKEHSPEIRDLIAKTKRARTQHLEKMEAKKADIAKRKAEGTFRSGPPKGYQHTPEARAAMTASLKERWASRREEMLAKLPRGDKHQWHNPDKRHRSRFTRLQCKEWKGETCSWCGSSDELVLDHVIPVSAGGTNDRYNAQTLCQPCNLFKAHFVDKPYYLARLGSQGGRT